MLPSRRNQIDRIELRMQQLEQRATRLLEREQQATGAVLSLERDSQQDPGRIRTMRAGRALRRRRRKLETLRRERRELIDGEIRSIMFSLQAQSQRTRDELDRLLARLAPVQEQWERLRSAFDTLEDTIHGPAFGPLAEQWTGQLQIPEFPIAQRTGYAKPFPQHALLF